MSYLSYYSDSAHFWEYQLVDSHGGKTTWQRYDPTVQEFIFDKLSLNKKLRLLKIEDTDFKIIFDHGNGNHQQRDVKTGSECAVRKTPEVMANDWDAFKTMVDVSKLILPQGSIPNINDNDTRKLVKRITDCKSLRILNLHSNYFTDAFGDALANSVAEHTTLVHLVLTCNNIGDETGVALGQALTTNPSLHTLDVSFNELGERGGAAIIRGLKHNTTLRVLQMHRNNLGENFGSVIQDDLQNNTGLYKLNLRASKLGDPSGVAFAKALTVNTTLKYLTLTDNNFGEESGAAFVDALTHNSTLTELNLDGNRAIFPATKAQIKFALSPELKGLLNTPSVSPSRIPVCVVGFDNVGKTELVNTWHRTTANDNPYRDPEETAEAKLDSERDKTSGISIKPITLRLDTMPPFSLLETPTKLWRTEGILKGVDITAWDFAGHVQYYLSHEFLMRACRGAVFVLLFRIDSLQPDVCHAEQQRLFFWLKFIASMCSNQQQQQPPTVFIGGSFRPDDASFDVKVTTEWTDYLLQSAKEVFRGVLSIPQHSIYHMDCRKSNDPHVVALRNTLAQAVEDVRTREDRKVPLICERSTSLLHRTTQEVTSKLVLFEKHMIFRQSNPNMPCKPLSWQDTVCSPIMTRADFEEHVLGKLEVKADGLGAANGFVDDLYKEFWGGQLAGPVTSVPAIAPKSKQLLQIITTYLHDVGVILWFDFDGLRDTVILTPDLFCSKIIGAIFRPDTPGFSIDAVHGGGGGLMPKAGIASTFKRALGIDDTHVDAALAILCQLGLCHRHQDPSNGELYLFPGALAPTTFRRPEWFGPLPSGRHFVVGRRFTLANPATTIFAPGCMSEMQVWAFGRYKGSMIWRDGVIIPYTATQTLAEAGVQLHRPYSTSQDGDRCAQVSMTSITLVVRGSAQDSTNDCLKLLDQLCKKIRTKSGTQLVEEALPPNELAKASTNNSNMLDVTCPGFAIPPTLDTAILDTAIRVVVGGNVCSIDSLRSGSFVDIPHPVQFIPTPKMWTGKDFEPLCAQTPQGGADLLVEIPRDHADFTRIENNMHRSMPNAVIRKIQRVQNRALWNKYFLARSDIANECDDESPNEIEAWHSTGTTDPWLICKDWKAGFDVNRSGIAMEYVHDDMGRLTRAFYNFENMSYGAGVYLAEHCIYSDTILPHVRPVSQDKQIILAKVTLGKNFDHRESVPNYRWALEPEGFHSISGTEGNMTFLLQEKPSLVQQGHWTRAFEELAVNGAVYGRQYVVHRSNQVYPAYLVTYK